MKLLKRSSGFSVRTVYKLRKPGVGKVLRKKLSFVIASLTLFSFVVGNMVGQHGWYAFWKTVMGKEDDALIVFVGTVPPVSHVVDYRKWSKYGGNPEEHTFRQVPQSALMPIPAYDPQKLNSGDEVLSMIYPVGFLGSYSTGKDHGGSHNGIDIDVPMGTKLVSIGNGVVEKTSMQEYGFGHYVLIRHPNVPDPSAPGKTRTFYSTYAHMDAIVVSAGQVVHKGEQIGTSGKSGDASGPHLHFQVDKGGAVDEGGAPFQPYWVFTGAEARQAGLTFNQAINSGLHQSRGDLYSVSPMLFVESYANYSQSSRVAASSSSRALTPAERRAERIKSRSAGRIVVAAVSSSLPAGQAGASSVSSVATVVAAETTETVVPASASAPTPKEVSSVDRLVIDHSGKLSNTWQKVTLTAVDKNGETVLSPNFGGRLYLVPEFGEAEIRPKELTPLDFVNGKATVNVLTRGTKTTFIATRGAFTNVSGPMVSK